GPALVVFARRDAPDLAARGLGYRGRRRKHDVVGGSADQVYRQLVDHAFQVVLPRRVLLLHFREHHDAFRAARRIPAAEYGDAAAPHAGEVAHRLLEFVGTDIAAAADDDVLLAPGEEQCAAGKIGAVAGVDPVAAAEERLGGFRVAVVARGGRGAAELQVSFLPVRQLQPRRVHHADVVARN